jgi:hypothetical protein
MNSQIELYAVDNDGTYPAALTDVTNEPNYFPDNTPVCPLGGTYTYNGTTYRVSCDH